MNICLEFYLVSATYIEKPSTGQQQVHCNASFQQIQLSRNSTIVCFQSALTVLYIRHKIYLTHRKSWQVNHTSTALHMFCRQTRLASNLESTMDFLPILQMWGVSCFGLCSNWMTHSMYNAFFYIYPGILRINSSHNRLY